jgi:hypothetical protein
VNQNATAAQRQLPQVAVDSKDNSIIVWYNWGDPYYNVYAQKFDRTGNAQWGASDVKVNQYGADYHEFPVVAIDSEDNAIVVWKDTRDSDSIYAQKLDSDGNRLWGSSDKQVNQNSGTVADYGPSVAIDSNNNAIIVWTDNRNGGSNLSIYAQKLNSTGDAQWGSSDMAGCS